MMTYRDMSERAERIQKMVHERARQACKEAGLDPNLLGIHPHNAMCSFEAGQPWKGVNYSKVRLCLRLCEKQWEASRVVRAWYVRQPSERIPQLFGLGK